MKSLDQELIEEYLTDYGWEYQSKPGYLSHIMFNDELELEFTNNGIEVYSVFGVFGDMTFDHALQYIDWLRSNTG